jgi:hypothetical protein
MFRDMKLFRLNGSCHRELAMATSHKVSTFRIAIASLDRLSRTKSERSSYRPSFGDGDGLAPVIVIARDFNGKRADAAGYLGGDPGIWHFTLGNAARLFRPVNGFLL